MNTPAKKTPPPSVVAVFKELLQKNLKENKAVITQEEAVEAIRKKMKCSKAAVLTKHYLEIEDSFRAEGWDVRYRKPGFNETFLPHFRFKLKSAVVTTVKKKVNPQKLLKAVKDLYKAGMWTCPTLSMKEQIALWTNLRDAAQIEVGTATKLGFSSNNR